MASDGVPENFKAGRILAIDNDVDSSTAASVSMVAVARTLGLLRLRCLLLRHGPVIKWVQLELEASSMLVDVESVERGELALLVPVPLDHDRFLVGVCTDTLQYTVQYIYTSKVLYYDVQLNIDVQYCTVPEPVTCLPPRSSSV